MVKVNVKIQMLQTFGDGRSTFHLYRTTKNKLLLFFSFNHYLGWYILIDENRKRQVCSKEYPIIEVTNQMYELNPSHST
jgi:hypothetical protein